MAVWVNPGVNLEGEQAAELDEQAPQVSAELAETEENPEIQGFSKWLSRKLLATRPPDIVDRQAISTHDV